VTPFAAQRPRAERAFERLYRKHVHAVYRYSLAVLHNEADAEDVTQTTFLSAYRAFQRGERPERPHNWLIKIAHNVCRQRFRDSSRRPQEVAFDETVAVGTTTDDDTDVPTATELRRALGFLGFNQRAALVMRELEGRSYAEIAQVLDVSVGAVETLIFRARRALREQLEGGLTCAEAKVTLSRLEQGKLPSSERGALRAHLRECKDCAVLERRSRAQRAAIKGIATIPLPPSLTSFFGAGATGGGAAVAGSGIGAKVVAVLAAGAVAGGLGYETATKLGSAEASSSKAAGRLTPVRDFSALARITHGGISLTQIGEPANGSRNGARGHGSRTGPGSHSGSAAGVGRGAGGSSSGAGSPGAGGSTVERVLQHPPPTPLRLPPPPPLPDLPVELPPVPPLPPPPPLPLPPPPPLPLPPPPPLPLPPPPPLPVPPPPPLP
jgi:RNA polymerase sigma factor (sigma-70 family)